MDLEENINEEQELYYMLEHSKGEDNELDGNEDYDQVEAFKGEVLEDSTSVG